LFLAAPGLKIIQLGAEIVKTDSLLAFYSLFSSPGEDTDNRTLIEATESGWWYTTRLPNGTRVVVYHADDDDPSSKLARRQEGFLDLLHNHTEHISQIILEFEYSMDPNARFPRCTAAGSSCLQPICDEANGWCAVGDAAMAFDPLSSQGIITALSLGCFIGDEIAKRVSKKDRSKEFLDISDNFRKVHEKYEKEKKYFYDLVQQFEGEFWKRRQR
jgi:flavin-dependent dehydrogenase